MYEKIFDWAGVAIQPVTDSQSDFRCDYFLAFMDGAMTDRYSEVNGNPPLDTDLGCTDDLTVSNYHSGNFFVQV